MTDNQNLNAGSGFAARLAAHICSRADEYEQRPDANAEWDAPRLDIARRMALALAILGDDDPRVKLIKGTRGAVESCDAALAAILAPVADINTERMAAAKAGTRFDGPALYNAGAAWHDWIAKQSAKRLDADIEGLVIALAVAVHEAEHDALTRRIDHLDNELQNARKPDPVIEDLRARVEAATREAGNLREQLVLAKAAEATTREALVGAQAELRDLAKFPLPQASQTTTPATPKAKRPVKEVAAT